jgi:RNA polymerase sigma-70 factor, ECF subfamily
MDSGQADLQEIYTAFHAKIQRYVTRLVGEAEAEDLTQEVFIKVSQALTTFRGEAQLSTWIYRIATNTVIDKTRTASFRQGAEQSELDEIDEAEALDLWAGHEPASLEAQIMRQEMLECFAKFVDRLPVNYRTAFVLSDLESLPNGEIADILGVSLETVKIRLHRGRAKLLQELRAHCKAEDWL